MTIYEWFDPYNVDHIEAYHHLEANGSWPFAFIPEDVELRSDGLWRIEIQAKMADAWMSHMGY